MKICLYGSASTKIAQQYIDAVYNLANQLAKRGHTLVFGGGSQGLMGAAARGVKAAGGKIIGVVPNFFKLQQGVLFEDCDTVHYCETMYERKQIMEETADCFLAVPGGIGTYDEFFGVTANRQLGRHNKKIAVYNINGFYDGLAQLVKHGFNEGFIGEYKDYFQVLNSQEEVIKYLEENN